MHLISIIIPTYNRRHCIETAVESVLAQSDINWELIIVDDGSTDDTKSVITPYLDDSRVGYNFQSHQGVSAARNKGALIANGDYLIFLDSDDRFYPGLIKTLMLVKFYNYDLISWPFIKKNNEEEKICTPKNLGEIYNNIKVSFLAGSICLRKKCFIEAGGYDNSITFGENYELGIRISHLANNIKLLKEPFLIYEMKKDKRTSDSISNRLYSGLLQYRKHRNKYLQNPPSDSKMSYILGFLFEKKNKKKTAFRFYSYAWKVYPLNYKAFLKIIIFKTLNFTK